MVEIVGKSMFFVLLRTGMEIRNNVVFSGMWSLFKSDVPVLMSVDSYDTTPFQNKKDCMSTLNSHGW